MAVAIKKILGVARASIRRNMRLVVSGSNELYTVPLGSDSTLKGYWRFESGAETTDSSGNSNTLSNIGTPTYGTGKFGQCVNLASASSQAFSITDATVLKPTGSFTIGGWVKSSSGGGRIFSSWNGASSKFGGITLGLATTTGLISFFSGKNTGQTAGTDYGTCPGTVDRRDGNWHFVVGTWDGSTMKSYGNGSQDGSNVSWANAPVYQSTNYVRVGCRNDGGGDLQFCNGSLDDVFIFNGKALSATEILNLYQTQIKKFMGVSNV